MDFVLRDAYMSGYSQRAFDLDRLIHYSFFTRQGLTIHERGLPALVRFITVRAELFRSIYFHRTVRSIDLSLQDLFRDSADYLFPGNPVEHLDQYRRFTDWSLLVDVERWADSPDERLAALGSRWREWLGRKILWKMVCERTVFFGPGKSEEMSVFSDEKLFEEAIRRRLPPSLREIHPATSIAQAPVLLPRARIISTILQPNLYGHWMPGNCTARFPSATEFAGFMPWTHNMRTKSPRPWMLCSTAMLWMM